MGRKGEEKQQEQVSQLRVEGSRQITSSLQQPMETPAKTHNKHNKQGEVLEDSPDNATTFQSGSHVCKAQIEQAVQTRRLNRREGVNKHLNNM